MSARDELNAILSNKEIRTNHPEDDNEDSASEQSAPPSPDANHAPQTGPANIPFKKQHSNTGPKGVIRDAQDHLASQLSRPDQRPRTAAPTANGQGSTKTFTQTTRPKTAGDAIPAAPEDDDAADEGFMEQWRRDRLRQLQSSSEGASGGGPNGQHGGLIPAVDGDGYLDAVDHNPGTVVVVFIYDETSEVSGAVEACLNKVARAATGRMNAQGRTRIKFVKLRYQEAEMEPAGVPAVLAYRDGTKFAGLVPLVDEIPDDAELNESTLERMLERHQIL